MAADISVTAAQVAAVYPDRAEIIDMLAAETITAGKALYQTSTGTAGVADANDSGKEQFRGIALTGGAAGQAISVLKQGHVYGFTLTALDHDSIVYLSDTAGALYDTNATMTVNCGRVVALPNAAKTKVLYITADWQRAWS